MVSIQKLRDMNLHAVADELEELRAKLAAMESQTPVAEIGSTATLYWCGSEPVSDIFNRHGLKVGDKLYAKPVPADKPKYKAVTASDLPMESSREHLLSEAANRADYFFRQIDGSYKFPSLGGQVSQIIEMLLAAANMPKGNTAVAVPDDVGMIPMINGKPKVTGRMKVECIGEFSWREEAPYYDENGELHDHVATHEVPWDVCKAIYKRMASVAMLEAAPSHNQQSADIDVDYPRDIFHRLISENSPYAFYLFQWVPYQTEAKQRRLKMLHDVKTFDGREAHGIWPNGRSCGPFKDDEVEFIRISRKQLCSTWTDPMPGRISHESEQS